MKERQTFPPAHPDKLYVTTVTDDTHEVIFVSTIDYDIPVFASSFMPVSTTPVVTAATVRRSS